MSANATGVEIPRNSNVSTVLRPTRPAPGTTRRGLFGVTGGTAFAPGDGLTAVVAVSGRLVTAASVGNASDAPNVGKHARAGNADLEAPPRPRRSCVANLDPQDPD